LAGIVASLSACDNVEWGGVEVRMEPPPPPPGYIPPDSLAAEEERLRLPPLPEGPVVYLARRTGGAVALLPVAELSGGSLEPLPSEADEPGFSEHFVNTLVPPGTEMVLLADGRRVGTFVAGETWEMEGSLCYPRLRILGVAELLPSAADIRDFLALPTSLVEGLPREDVLSTASTPEMRTASLNAAGVLMNQFRTPWPPTVVETRRDLTVFHPRELDAPAFAASFVHLDGLRVGSAPADAWSIFYVARPNPEGSGYQTTLVRHSLFRRDGKSATRMLTQADVTGDGREEILLEVFGEESRWLAVGGFQGGEWRTVFEEPCAPDGGTGVTPP